MGYTVFFCYAPNDETVRERLSMRASFSGFTPSRQQAVYGIDKLFHDRPAHLRDAMGWSHPPVRFHGVLNMAGVSYRDRHFRDIPYSATAWEHLTSLTTRFAALDANLRRFLIEVDTDTFLAGLARGTLGLPGPTEGADHVR